MWNALFEGDSRTTRRHSGPLPDVGRHVTGTVVLRQNQVMHESGHGEEAKTRRMGHVPGIPSRCFGVWPTEGQCAPSLPLRRPRGNGYAPFELPLNGTSYFTDSDGRSTLT